MMSNVALSFGMLIFMILLSNRNTVGDMYESGYDFALSCVG